MEWKVGERVAVSSGGCNSHYEILVIEKVGKLHFIVAGNKYHVADGGAVKNYMPAARKLTPEIEAQVAAAVAMWQPIKTAPRDGTYVLLCGRYGTAYSSCWIGAPHNRWRDGTPTHWMPLPTAPNGDSEAGRKLSNPAWCVKWFDRDPATRRIVREIWCAVADGRKPHEGDSNVSTRCGQFVVLPGGISKTEPTCTACLSPQPARE